MNDGYIVTWIQDNGLNSYEWFAPSDLAEAKEWFRDMRQRHGETAALYQVKEIVVPENS